MTKVIRISDSAYETLDQLGQAKGLSKQIIIEKALKKMARESLLDAANKAYAELRADPKKWQEELEERAEWESTLSDGLEDL